VYNLLLVCSYIEALRAWASRQAERITVEDDQEEVKYKQIKTMLPPERCDAFYRQDKFVLDFNWEETDKQFILG